MNPFRSSAPEPSNDLKAALADLERLGRDHPDLLDASGRLAAILAAAFGVVDDDVIDPSTVEALRLDDDRPAFARFPPSLSAGVLDRRARAIADLADAPAFREGLRRRKIDLGAWSRLWLAGDRGRVLWEAEAIGVSAEVAAARLRLILLPSLARLTAAAGESSRRSGDLCPFCGSEAALAESRGLERSRSLRCGLCAGDWPAPRLGCPRCGSEAVRLWTIEGENGRRSLADCEECGNRLKIVSTLAPLGPARLVAAELSLVHLDFLEPTEPPETAARPIEEV